MKFLDLFSGIGGFRVGLEMAGHECVGHCEIDRFANKSYMAMHDVKESEWFGEDITKVRADELPRADIWCFGFPCQDISIAGKQSGFGGHRSSLFFTVTRLIRDLEEENRPSILFVENVKNLLSINRGGDFLKLLIELDEIGYDAEWQVLNSKDFGVPQNRERVFIIGHLRGRGGQNVFPITGYTTGTLTGWQGDISGKQYASQQDRVNTYKGISCCLPKARAITKCKVQLKDGTIRVLSARERMRCQSFPDEYTDRALTVVRERDLLELVGNSVTVNVIYEIARRF